MGRKQTIEQRIAENPDHTYISIEDTLFYCKNCLSTRIRLAISGWVYCAHCDKLIANIRLVVEQLDKGEKA